MTGSESPHAARVMVMAATAAKDKRRMEGLLGLIQKALNKT